MRLWLVDQLRSWLQRSPCQSSIGGVKDVLNKWFIGQPIEPLVQDVVHAPVETQDAVVVGGPVEVLAPAEPGPQLVHQPQPHPESLRGRERRLEQVVRWAAR